MKPTRSKLIKRNSRVTQNQDFSSTMANIIEAKKELGSERKLRSKSQEERGDDNRFNFDVTAYKIDPKKKLNIVSRGTRLPAGSQQLNAERKQLSKMKLAIKKCVLRNISKRHEDMLSDDIYRPYHKRMLKQENRMINNDKLQSEAEAERLQRIFEKLDSMDWKSSLVKITVIQNLDDDKELEDKRILTKKAIEDMLDKFHDMKNRSNLLSRNYKVGRIDPVKNPEVLYDKVDKTLIMGYESSSDEEEEAMSMDEIRTHRRLKREQRYGCPVVIHLKESARSRMKFTIVAEPLRKPYIAKNTKDEKDVWNKKAIGPPDRFEYYPPLPKQAAIRREKTEIPLTIKPLPLKDLNSIYRYDGSCVKKPKPPVTRKNRKNISKGKKKVIHPKNDSISGHKVVRESPARKRRTGKLKNSI